MRIELSSTSPVKKLSKVLSKSSGKHLAVCQNVLAGALGYRDWHDLNQCVSPSANNRSVLIEIEDAADIINKVSQNLNINAGEVQHIFSTTRLFGEQFTDPDKAVLLRATTSRKLNRFPAKAGQPGCICNLNGKEGNFILRQLQGDSAILMSSDLSSCTYLAAKHEIIFPNPTPLLTIPPRLWMPYGRWVEEDGSEVLFSRDYFPLWRIRTGSSPERLDPSEIIKYQSRKYFWHMPPWEPKGNYERCLNLIRERNIRSTPILVEFFYRLLEEDNIKRDDIRSSSNIRLLF